MGGSSGPPPSNVHLPLLSPHPSSLRPLPLLKDEDTFWSQRYVSALGHQKLLIPNIRTPHGIVLQPLGTLHHSPHTPSATYTGPRSRRAPPLPEGPPHACAHPPGAHTGSHRRTCESSGLTGPRLRDLSFTGIGGCLSGLCSDWSAFWTFQTKDRTKVGMGDSCADSIHVGYCGLLRSILQTKRGERDHVPDNPKIKSAKPGSSG